MKVEGAVLPGNDDPSGANGLVRRGFQSVRDIVGSDAGGEPKLKRVGRRIRCQDAKCKVRGIRLDPCDDIGHEIGNDH